MVRTCKVNKFTLKTYREVELDKSSAFSENSRSASFKLCKEQRQQFCVLWHYWWYKWRMGILNGNIHHFRRADASRDGPIGNRGRHFHALTVTAFAYKYQTHQLIYSLTRVCITVTLMTQHNLGSLPSFSGVTSKSSRDGCCELDCLCWASKVSWSWSLGRGVLWNVSSSGSSVWEPLQGNK